MYLFSLSVPFSGFSLSQNPRKEMPCSIWSPSMSYKYCFPSIHMNMWHGIRFPALSLIAKWWQLSSQLKKWANILCLTTAHLGHELCLQTTEEGNLTSSSLIIYFHHHFTKSRQAKFASFACHRVGSFTTAFPVSVPRSGAQEARALIVCGERATLMNGTSSSFHQ